MLTALYSEDWIHRISTSPAAPDLAYEINFPAIITFHWCSEQDQTGTGWFPAAAWIALKNPISSMLYCNQIFQTLTLGLKKSWTTNFLFIKFLLICPLSCRFHCIPRPVPVWFPMYLLHCEVFLNLLHPAFSLLPMLFHPVWYFVSQRFLIFQCCRKIPNRYKVRFIAVNDFGLFRNPAGCNKDSPARLIL